MTKFQKPIESKSYSRREFTSASVLAILSTVPILVSSCGGDNSSPTAPSASTGGQSMGTASVTGSVGENHGHSAVVTAVQLTGGQDILLDITGVADHRHTIAITVAELNQMAGGVRVSKASSVNDADAHSHIVTFN